MCGGSIVNNLLKANVDPLAFFISILVHQVIFRNLKYFLICEGSDLRKKSELVSKLSIAKKY
ncbi:hypothetical protein GCM10007940_22380 [Portibacter lacus]|uniref:Uncharacterized protein n=1 Tax=Portibacter lacus TaxID=1099794 RepID=A0AA37WE78_9BACT|nr:hypothetical protein GCM10007940_22380 [Portibacter lacus]